MAAATESAPTRLLVVDDEAALREPLSDQIVRQGFTQGGLIVDDEQPGRRGFGQSRHAAPDFGYLSSSGAGMPPP